MHLPRRTALVLSAALLATAFAPAEDASCRTITDPADPEATISFCEAKGYFSSSNPAKADNLVVTGQTAYPTWTADAPGSVTAGNGAGFVAQWETTEVSGEADEVSGVTYVGTFDGALDAIAVEQYLFSAAEELWGEYMLVATLRVDDQLVYATELLDGVAVPITAGGSAVKVFRVAITDIFADTEFRDGVHEVELNLTPYFVTDEAVYVYGAAEAPSAITFNPSTLSGFATIKASQG